MSFETLQRSSAKVFRMDAVLDFEQPIVLLENKLKDLRELSNAEGVDFSAEIKALEKKWIKLVDDTFACLSPWQRVQLSRHPNRPYARDYIDHLFPTFRELHGDRAFGDDAAILGGVAHWNDEPVMILAHQKGRSTKQKMERNFGMARPEGYRKVIRLLDLAQRSQMPVISLIDTPGAFPGADAEERGQSQAIAECILRWFELDVPSVSVVIGEGGSGGALAIGVGNAVLMQEFSIYSVISPESCASILWSNAALADKAAAKLKMNSSDCLRLKVIDEIIPEPRGGAHRNWIETFANLQNALDQHLKPLQKQYAKKPDRIKAQRFEKFRKMGELAVLSNGATK